MDAAVSWKGAPFLGVREGLVGPFLKELDELAVLHIQRGPQRGAVSVAGTHDMGQQDAQASRPFLERQAIRF